MPTTLKDIQFDEGSTGKITASFTDAAGAAVVPTSIKWTYTDEDGNVIGTMEDIVVAVPASTISIILSGDDLGVQSATDNLWRIILVEAVYSSDEGNDLPLNDELHFSIEDLVNKT